MFDYREQEEFIYLQQETNQEINKVVDLVARIRFARMPEENKSLLLKSLQKELLTVFRGSDFEKAPVLKLQKK